jgi:ABC-2 type transport system ATP-binding protein
VTDAQALPLEVADLRKAFGPLQALAGVSLVVSPGENLGLLGPNGAGKTTLVRAVAGRVSPDAGRFLVFGWAPEDARAKALSGWVPQEISLYSLLTPAENLWTFGRYQGLSGRALDDAVARSLEWSGLAERRKDKTGSLSGGMRRRLNIAAGTIHDPKLLLLDEPTAGVDPSARRDFWDHIHELAHQGITVLVSTHYMDEAERCHAIAYISYGKLLAHGTLREVIDQAGLSTWQLEGPDIMKVAAALRGQPGVEMVAPFGNTLHVSGTDAEPLKRSVESARRAGLTIEEVAPTLEDVFIHMMRDAGTDARKAA